MNKISFPLNRRVQGPQVADLHSALQALLDRALMLPNDEAARGELAAALRRELELQSFGEATGKLVSVFQRERHLQRSGEVDGPTADALNKLLHEMGLLDQERPPTFSVGDGSRSPRGRASLTVGDGRYAFSFDAKSRIASLEVRAVKPDGKEVALSKPLNDLTAESRANLNFLAPGRLQPLADDLTGVEKDEGEKAVFEGIPAGCDQPRAGQRL